MTGPTSDRASPVLPLGSLVLGLAMAVVPLVTMLGLRGGVRDRPPAPPLPVSATPRVTAAEPLLELGTSVQSLDDENAELRLRLLEALPLPRGGRKADLTATLSRLGGRWQEGVARALQTGAAAHLADGSDLQILQSRLRGTLKLAIRGGPTTRPMTCAVDAELSAAHLDTSEPEAAGSQERFWVIQPESQGPQRTVRGTWRGAMDGQELAGAVEGKLILPVRPGKWNMGGIDGGGVRLDFHMGVKRQNWNHVRLAVCQLPRARDLRAHDGLRLRIAAHAPRADVSVSVWLREEDGSWYYCKSAVPLADAVNEAVLLFEDFAEAEWVAPGSHMDEDYALDLSAVSHVAVGIVNSLGVGPVPITLQAIELVKCDLPAQPPAKASVTGQFLSVNGHTVVPPGLFGGYANDLPQEFRPGCQRYLTGPPTLNKPRPGATEAYMVDCWFDRYSTAVLLNDPNWESNLAEWGRRYGRKARELDYTAYLEFWNEPYLNWATRPGKHYDPSLYKTSDAREGGPVQVQYRVRGPATNPKAGSQYDLVDGPVIPHFAWRRAGEGWKPYDTTQFSYWSGRGNGWIYDRMLGALGPALKAANPRVRLIAGWGYRWHEDHWAGWDILYKPTIDRNIDWIDIIDEHHYQGDSNAMVGAYEVLTAYGVTRHNKWLWSINTETNDLVDAPARGVIDTLAKAEAATQYRRMVYNLRDILYCVAQAPDKMIGRTVIHPNKNVQSIAVAYGLLRDFRGRMLKTDCDDPDVWCVAAIDGTDPAAMPPEGGRKLVAFIFNDHRRRRDVELILHVPAGAELRSGMLQWPTVDRASWEIGIAGRELPAPPPRRPMTLKLSIPERSAYKISFPLHPRSQLAPHAQAQRRQFFSPMLLQTVRPNQPVAMEIRLERKALAAAGRAWLRLVVEDVAPGEAAVAIGGGDRYVLPLPKAYTADNCNRVLEIPLDIDRLAPLTPMRFRVRPGNHDGYRVDMASVVLEHVE